MSNLLYLIKIEFTRTIAGAFYRKNNKKRARPILYFLLLVFGLFLGISFIYNVSFIFMFKDLQVPYINLVLLFAGLASLLTFISSINQSKSIYIGSDYDLLITLPIRKRDIIISKISILYLLELLFSSIVLIPTGICLFIFTNETILGLISFLLAVLIPIFPVAVASLISLGLTLMTARFKYGNIITAILYLPFVLVMSMMGFFMRNSDVTTFETMGNTFKWMNPSLLFIELSISKSYLFLLAFVGANLLLFLITVFLFAVSYSKLHLLVTSVRMKNNYVRKDLGIQNELKTLLSIDLKRLFNSRMYLLNSLTGAFMAILAILMLIISTKNIPVSEAETAYTYYDFAIPIAIATLMFTFSIANPSSSAISIEGKTFWLTKTLPISKKKYMLSKLLLTYVFYFPSSIIASTISVIFYHNDIFGCVMTYIIPLLFTVLVAIIGLILNVKYPKFKWQNESEVVKNSLPVGLTMLFGSLINVFIGAIIITGVLWNTIIAYIIGVVILIILIVVCYVHLDKIFLKKLDAMEDL